MTENKKSPLTLRVFSPVGAESTIGCDSVRLFVTDGENGKNGGLIGIHCGHAPAMIALGEGPALAFLQGEKVYEDTFPGGIAVVERDAVTVFSAPAEKTEP